MKLVCPKCGNTKKFYANQSVQGTITVIVNENGDWIENPNDTIDTNGLHFGNPHGSYTCQVCDYEDVTCES